MHDLTVDVGQTEVSTGVAPPDKVELLPAKYSDPMKTELTADASDEINDFKFDLK